MSYLPFVYLLSGPEVINFFMLEKFIMLICVEMPIFEKVNFVKSQQIPTRA